jgi:hypothetical protein
MIQYLIKETTGTQDVMPSQLLRTLKTKVAYTQTIHFPLYLHPLL